MKRSPKKIEEVIKSKPFKFSNDDEVITKVNYKLKLLNISSSEKMHEDSRNISNEMKIDKSHHKT